MRPSVTAFILALTLPLGAQFGQAHDQRDEENLFRRKWLLFRHRLDLLDLIGRVN